jgi:acyl carrier protein
MTRASKKSKVPQVKLATEPEIRDWLIARIAQLAETSPEAIDTDRPFADFGLDSVQVAELSGDLEFALGRSVPETAPWEYPTIALLAAFLSGREEVAAKAPASDWDDGQW